MKEEYERELTPPTRRKIQYWESGLKLLDRLKDQFENFNLSDLLFNTATGKLYFHFLGKPQVIELAGWRELEGLKDGHLPGVGKFTVNEYAYFYDRQHGIRNEISKHYNERGFFETKECIGISELSVEILDRIAMQGNNN